jgi:hypothetical protein
MSPEQAVDEVATVNADIAGELQKLARMRSSRQSEDKDGEVAAGSTFGIFQHVIDMSLGAIDQVIVELTQIRDHLQKETNRVHGELAGYTQMTQVALQVALKSAEAITESLPQFRSAGSELGLQPNGVALDD